MPPSWLIDVLRKQGGARSSGTASCKIWFKQEREAEDMCNYSEYLKQKAKEEEKLEMLEQLEADHYSDMQIMRLLRIDVEQLKSLREKLQEKRTAVTAD